MGANRPYTGKRSQLQMLFARLLPRNSGPSVLTIASGAPGSRFNLVAQQ
jgi:hypothetical protein